MPDTDTRIRSAIHTYAETMVVERPPLSQVLTSSTVPTLRTLPARPARPRSTARAALTAAAVVLLVLSALALVRYRDGSRVPPVQASSGTVPVIWPYIGNNVPPERRSTAAAAADAYVGDVLGLDPEQWQPDGDDGPDDRNAAVQYQYSGDYLMYDSVRVELVEIDGSWFVTSSFDSKGPRITEARIVDGDVRVEAVPRDADTATMGRLAIEVFADDGTMLQTAHLGLHDGRWETVIDLAPGETASSVQVLLGEPGPLLDRVPLHAASIVLPASVEAHPAQDLFPAAMGGSYYDAWIDTLTHPDDPRADWEQALISYISTVGNGTPPDPTFEEVATRADGFEKSGRFRTADGGAGTFELARLQPGGPWYLISLVDDAFEVRDVTFTDTQAEITLVVAEDYTLGAGRLLQPPPGQPIDETGGKGGQEGVYVQDLGPGNPSNPTVSVFLAELAADDGAMFRFFDAFAP